MGLGADVDTQQSEPVPSWRFYQPFRSALTHLLQLCTVGCLFVCCVSSVYAHWLLLSWRAADLMCNVACLPFMQAEHLATQDIHVVLYALSASYLA